MKDIIKKHVHQLYWDFDINCARTSLICLSELFKIDLSKQTINSAIGLHGAGGYRAQCGLVEGVLMFIGIYFSKYNKSDTEIANICYQFADSFKQNFGSLLCYDLRPNGFTNSDLPHLCENLTVDAIDFAYNFILQF